MRESAETALVMFLSNRTVSRPFVAEMAAHLAEAGICDADTFMEEYDVRTQDALQRWLVDIPVQLHAEAIDILRVRLPVGTPGVKPPTQSPRPSKTTQGRANCADQQQRSLETSAVKILSGPGMRRMDRLSMCRKG